MRIQFKMTGGLAYFPGLSKPVTIDSNELTIEEARELERLVDAARLFDLPTQINTAPLGAADYQHYTIEIEHGGRSHRVQLADPVESSLLQALLDYLRTKAIMLQRTSQMKKKIRRDST